MSGRFSRREFLEKSGLASAAAAAATFGAGTGLAAGAMPHRVLGKTGARVSIIAFGCGSRLSMYGGEDAAVAALNLALDSGIAYFDTAYGYGNGRSETWVGEVAKTRRKEFFLATKIEPRNGDEARRILEGSLKRLQTDQIDLIHVHALHDEEDLKRVEAKDGVLNALYKLRDEKVTRFVGMTSHYDPSVLRTAIERHDLDCVQMALNAALQGMTTGSRRMILNPSMHGSFQQIALPAARRKNLGILAMKVTGQEALIGSGPGKSSAPELLQYALSLPVASAVVGMPNHEFIRSNAAWARNFEPMGRTEMNDFSRRMAAANKLALDQTFAHHIDA
ncbi:MAG: aldo/keto reductase [Terriglobia bacterium]